MRIVKSILFVTFFLFVYFVLCIVTIAQDLIDIDIINERINGKPIIHLTFDDVTDIFGRPSASLAPGMVWKHTGVVLRYRDLGLNFVFIHPRIDTEQHIAEIYIFLTSQLWFDKGFEAFRGSISKGVNANWKANRVIREFSEFNPKNISDDHEILIKRKSYKVEFNYDPNTTFLDLISIVKDPYPTFPE